MAIESIYLEAPSAFAGQEVDWENGNFNVALLDDEYTPDTDNDVAWIDISTHEIPASGGYVSGGATIGNTSIAKNVTGGYVDLQGDSVEWPSASFTARYAVVYENVGANDSDKKLLKLIDFEANQSPTGENFTIVWAEGSVIRLVI